MSDVSAFEKEFGVIPLNTLEPTHHLRRANDLFMVPEDRDSVEYFCIAERVSDQGGLSDFLLELEDGEYTGFIKISNGRKKMRAAMALYRGRGVGAVHVDATDTNTPATEEALSRLLDELKVQQTLVMKYKQRDELVTSFSGLFLGYPIEREDDFTAHEYLEYVSNWFAQKDSTATLAFSYKMRTALVFFHKGEYIGFYDIDDVTFDTGETKLKRFLERMPLCNLEASILPPEMLSSKVNYGFKLSSLLT